MSILGYIGKAILGEIAKEAAKKVKDEGVSYMEHRKSNKLVEDDVVPVRIKDYSSVEVKVVECKFNRNTGKVSSIEDDDSPYIIPK